MADTTYQPKTYRKEGGDTHVIASGGKLLVESGGAIHKNYSAATTLATAGAETLTAAMLLSGLILRDPAGAGRTDTTDTAAAIIAAADLDNDGDSIQCIIINTADAAEAITLAGGTGVTFGNVGQTIAQNESAILLLVRASSTTINAYIVGA